MPNTSPQLSHVLNALKFMLAVPGSQILSEGMTQAQVHTAMEQLRSSSVTGSVPGASGTATPLMKAAARRLSQEAAMSSSGGDPAAGAAASSVSGAAALGRRLSTDAAATAAALLQEASHMSHTSKLGADQLRRSSDVEEAEPLDVNTAVSLAEACAQVSMVATVMAWQKVCNRNHTPHAAPRGGRRHCQACDPVTASGRFSCHLVACTCRQCGARRTTAWKSRYTSHRYVSKIGLHSSSAAAQDMQ